MNCPNCEKLKADLLSAQVAIAKIKAWLDDEANKVRERFEDGSPTLLDERLAAFIETGTLLLAKHDENLRKEWEKEHGKS